MDVIATLLRGLVAALAVSLVLTASASAHAEIVGADPAAGSVVAVAPERLQLLFSEPIGARFYSIRVYDANRSRVDRGTTFLSDSDHRVVAIPISQLSTGTYTVVWRVFSLDGHVARGAFAFGVGAGAPPRLASVLEAPDERVPPAFDLGARWGLYVGLLLIVGGLAFRVLVLGSQGTGTGPSTPDVDARVRRRVLWIVASALAVALVCHLVGFLLQAASVAEVPLGDLFRGNILADVLGSTRYGAVWLARTVLFVALIAAMVGIARDLSSSRRWDLGGIIGAALLLTISLVSHASTVDEQAPIAVALDWIHQLAASLWLGGLVQVLAVLIGERRQSFPASSARAGTGLIVRRFSAIAAVSILVLVLTGLYAAVVHIPSWSALVDTSYGAAFSGKLLLVLPLLGFGAASALLVSRGMVVRKKFLGGVRPPETLLPTLVAEVTLGFVILAVTAILTTQQPAAAVVAARPFREIQQVGAASVELSVTPNRAGDNRIEVGMRTPPGEPLLARQIPIRLAMLDMDMGAQELMAEQVGPGRYEVSEVLLSMAGRWGVAVGVPDSGTGSAPTFEVTVGQPPESNRPALSPLQVLLLAASRTGSDGSPVPNWQFLSAALALVLGSALLVWRATWQGTPTGGVRGRSLLATGICLLIFGLPLGGVALAEAYYRSQPPPLPNVEDRSANDTSVGRGRAVYQYCTACHGPEGQGDGPAATQLDPPPSNLRSLLAAGHTDDELYRRIRDGVAGTAMPPFGDILSNDEIQDVVSYLQSLASSD